AAGSGGVLAVDTATDRNTLVKERDRLLVPGTFRAELVSIATSMARQAALKLDLVRPAIALMRRLGMEEERKGYRIALDASGLAEALRLAPALRPFDPWVRADLHDYRARRGRLATWYQARRLAKVPGERPGRLAGVRLLAELPAVA